MKKTIVASIIALTMGLAESAQPAVRRIVEGTKKVGEAKGCGKGHRRQHLRPSARGTETRKQPRRRRTLSLA